MPISSDHRRALVALCGALFLCALCCLYGARAAHGTQPGSTPGRGAPGASRYPSGASRPSFRPRSSEFARAATSAQRSSSSGGAVAPGSSGSPKTSSPTTTGGHKLTLHDNPARALVAFQAMQKTYYRRGSGLYVGEPFSYLWPFSQALAATVSMANIPHLGVSLSRELQARLTGLDSYLDTDNSGAAEGTYTSALPAFDGAVAPPTGPGGTKYYDDNDWVGIELVRVYKLTHVASVLGSAEGIMAFEMAGWQANPELGCPGGLPFSNAAA